MYQITSTKWDSFTLYNQVQLITKHFMSKQFAKLYNGPVTVLPGMNTLVMLRSCRSATLEVLENLDTGTVYRIRQNGVVVATTLDYVDTTYPDLETYLKAPMKGNVIFKFPVKELVYTLHQHGYGTSIKRHKKPRFTGTIEISDNQVLDGPSGTHIGVNEVSWIDSTPDSSKEIDTVMKKTILFIRANYPPAKVNTSKPARLTNGFYGVEEPNEQVIFGPSGTGRSRINDHDDQDQNNFVNDGEPKHFPQPFKPSKVDLISAAQTLAKYFSPNKVLTDPDTGEHLARGERNTTPDQDTP